jgi:hypothetical protein
MVLYSELVGVQLSSIHVNAVKEEGLPKSGD